MTAIASALGPAHARRVVMASFIGTTIELYDFFIYAQAAALVFGPQFFPNYSAAAGTLAAFSAAAVGFIARPLGAIVMGHFGDRLGRKTMLVLSLTLMGGSTVLIGVLPTYEQIGVLAPALLVLLRCVQGFGVGGEWGGAVLMAVEYAPPDRRGLYGAFPQIGAPTGIILSNGAFLAVGAFVPGAGFTQWGWRIPFLLSALLIAVGLFVRLRVEETPIFRQERQKEHRTVPLLAVLREHPGRVILGALAFAGTNAFGYIFVSYVLAYGVSVLRVPRPTMLLLVLIAAACLLAACLFFAAQSDRLGRRKVYLLGAGVGLAWAFPFFLLLDTGRFWLMLLALVVATWPLAATFAPLAAMFSELFPTSVRYTGASLSYQLGAVLGGGLAPLIAVVLFEEFGTSLAISAYLFAGLAIGVVAVLLTPETSRRDLASVPAKQADSPALGERTG